MVGRKRPGNGRFCAICPPPDFEPVLDAAVRCFSGADLSQAFPMKRFAGRAAFSLLEVMVALMVMAVATMAMATAIAHAKGTVDVTESRDRVLREMDNILENDVQAFPFKELTQGMDVAGSKTVWYPVEGVEPTSGRLNTIRMVIEPTGVNELVKVTLDAAWEEATGPTSFGLQFYHAYRGE